MDLGAVLECPGVVEVALAADVPGENNYGSAVHDDPIFAPDLVQYVGQPLFAVAADAYTTARKAARRARIDYEALPAILDIRAALAAQLEGKGRLVVCIFGDGAAGAGALHETLNIAALWRLPLLLICDNNGLSVSTPREAALAPTKLSDLAAPFGVRAATVDGTDVEAVWRQTADFAALARAEGGGPAMLECLSARFFSHSTATRATRDAATMRTVKARCPIRLYTEKLQSADRLGDADLARIEAEVDELVAGALACADASPYPDPAGALSDVG